MIRVVGTVPEGRTAILNFAKPITVIKGNVYSLSTSDKKVNVGIEGFSGFKNNVVAKETKTYTNNYIYVNQGTQINTVVGVQLELGSVFTPYEPYHAQTVTLSAPVTLRGVPIKTGGNVTINGQMYAADRIVERDGAVGVERWTKRLELPVADMNNSESSPGWNRKGFTENLSNPVYSVSAFAPKCDKPKFQI